MAVKNPIGIDASGDLYEMDATDLATKNPICLYSGELKELQSGDTLPGGGGGGGTDPVIHEYTANATWTKPTASNFYGVMVVCVASGSGGGSGACDSTSTAACGGGAGGGGSIAFRFISAAALTNATETVTVGAGGLGGAPQTAFDTAGNNGGLGSDTSFGAWVIAKPNPSAASGGRINFNTSGGAGGGTSTRYSNTPAGTPFELTCVSGGSGRNVAGSTSAVGLDRDNGCPGGGGGGGLNSSNTNRVGGAGGSIRDEATIITGPAGGTAGGGNGGNGAQEIFHLLFDLEVPTTNGLATGGSGGGSNNAGAGGAGGNGFNGSGGGGGGAGFEAASGAGGDGGDGICYVVEYYGA